MKNIKNILKTNEYLIIIISFIIIILFLLFIPNLDNSFIISNKLYINEIMVNNTYTNTPIDSYSDYIEIYNGYNYPINLEGYHLSDSEFETDKWTFPSIEIQSQDYLIVYADGLDICTNNECHTNFKLNSKGEILTLTDSKNNIINKFTYPSMSNDISYGYNGRKYSILNSPTPGSVNSSKLKYQILSNKQIYINEYMLHNQRTTNTTSGNYLDFVELHNTTNEDITLNNIYLTDNPDNLTKYKLPNITIKKNNYLLVYLSNQSQFTDTEIIANFKLSNQDKYLILSNGKKVIDKLEIVELIDNVSYGIKDGNWYYFTKPTPGYENNTLALTTIGGINEHS